MKRLMKHFKMSGMLLLLVLGFSVNVYALASLPKADMLGRLVTNTSSLSLSSDTNLYKLTYLDGTLITANSLSESIIGAKVSIVGAARLSDPNPLDDIYPFTNAQLEVRGADGFLYVSATIKNLDLVLVSSGTVVTINPNLDANNPATLNLSFAITDNPNNGLFTDGTHPSQYVTDWQTALGTGTVAGMTIVAPLFGDPAGNSSSDILIGVLDGSPPAPPPPPGVRSMGYWKTHDDERAYYLSGAIAVDNNHQAVFQNSLQALADAVTTKGKKTMLQKAQQELAALLLNIAAGLSESTPLSDPQKQNIEPVSNTPTIWEDTVGEAVDDIEAVILNSLSTSSQLERVKDLAESINTAE